MPREDLLRFVKELHAEVKIEELKLYTKSSKALNDAFLPFYESAELTNMVVPLNGQKIPKNYHISTDLFRIKKKDLSLLKEVIDSGAFDFNVKVGEGKEKKSSTIKSQEIKPTETTLSYTKTTGKFRFGDSETIPISPTHRHKVREMAEKLMQAGRKGSRVHKVK